MIAGRTRNGPVEIAFEAFGPADGTRLLLVMAACLQMNLWHDDFVANLSAAGFRVARFDNRDSGLSSHLPEASPHHSVTTFVRPAGVAPYRLTDMADDAAAVLDALAWDAAHVVGFSMGGMIAQSLALEHPTRVRSLTLLASLPGWRPRRMRYGWLPACIRIARRPVRNRRDAGDRMVDLFRVVGSPDYPGDEEWLRHVGEQGYDRDPEPLFTGWTGPLTAAERQVVAVGASGDLRPLLRAITVPTVIVHGLADPVVHRRSATALATAITDARLISYAGMGHDIPAALWPAIVDEIATTASMM